MVFKQPLVSNLKPHCFHLDSSLKRSSNISNWLGRIPTQSSLVNSELLFFITIQYTITPLVQVFCLLIFKSYHDIFHSWCQVRFTYILSTNVCQLQTSFTPLYFVHLALLSILYKMHFSCNMSGIFCISTILSHAHGRFAIQDN